MVFILLCLDNILHVGINLLEWDLLLLSGVVIFIPAVHLAFTIPDKLDQTLNRLVHRGTLELAPGDLSVLEKDLQNMAQKWAKCSGIFVTIAMLLAFLIAYQFSIPTEMILLTALEVMGGFIAGAFLGGMASYGRLGKLLKQRRHTIKIQPGHLDGVAGLKPVGDFYFRQAMIVAIPALFLSAWLFINQLGYSRFDHWKLSYIGLLGVAIIFEVLAFWMPLLSFHQEMVTQKKVNLQKADELSKEMRFIQLQLTHELDAERRKVLEDRLSSMTKEYWDIEHLPTWPVSVRIKRLFKRNNLTLLLPLFIEMINVTSFGKSHLWQKIGDAIRKVVE